MKTPSSETPSLVAAQGKVLYRVEYRVTEGDAAFYVERRAAGGAWVRNRLLGIVSRFRSEDLALGLARAEAKADDTAATRLGLRSWRSPDGLTVYVEASGEVVS